VDPAKLLSFVLNYGKINAKQDGSVATSAKPAFGWAGQAYNKHPDSTSAPKSTYGFEIFDKIKDKGE
jgi:hypothetical protein